MPYIPLPSLPGVFKDDTPLAAEGFYTDADKMRFVRGRAQTIGGWATASTDVFEGVARGIHVWSSGGVLYTAFGTNTGLYVFSDGAIYDITPIVTVGSVSNPFTTVITETTVTFALASHGMVDGQRIIFPGQTTVNGADISDENGYAVEVVDANSVTFTAGSAATSSGSGAGGTVDYDILLAPGLVDNLGGPGYGVGGYGIGGYGEGAELTEYFSRSWSLDNWVPNLLANPRGGGIYEWAPNFSDTELVTNGDFSSATGWTQGSGWSIGAGIASFTTTGASTALSTQISALPNSYLMLEFDATMTTGTINIQVAGVEVLADIATTGRKRNIIYTGVGGDVTLGFVKEVGAIGSLDNVICTQMTRAAILPGAPTQNDTMLVTPELIVMVFGTIDADTGDYNPLQVRNSDTGDGDLSANQTWTPSPENLAFRYTLGKGGRCVAGRLGNGEILIWTDNAMYRARYTGDPTNVYAYQLIANGCGLIGTNAAAVLSGVVYFVTPGKEFMAYAGGAPVELQSTMERYFSDNLSPSQQDKIFAFPMTGFGEVWWLYPDIRDGNECSRYVMLNTMLNCWSCGTFERTCWNDAFATQAPMATGTDGVLHFQETGNTDNGNPLTWRLETAAMDIKLNGTGGELYQIDFFVPDAAGLVGGYNYTMNAYEYPNSDPVVYGPYPVTSLDTLIDFTPVIARQASHLFEATAAPAFCRFGSPRLVISPTGMEF